VDLHGKLVVCTETALAVLGGAGAMLPTLAQARVF
jgi:hypothetical protein